MVDTGDQPAGRAATTGSVRIRVVSTGKLATYAGVAVAIAVGLGIVAALVRVTGAEFPGHVGLVALFNLDSEFNVPTMVAVIGLTLCAVLLAVVAGVARSRAPRDARRFALLSGVFLYLALDEGSRLHERLNEPLRELGLSSGPFRFGWVLVFGVLVLAMIPVYLPLVWRLPARVRALFLGSAGMYVTGALLLEMVGAQFYDPDATSYVLVTVLEESLELGGIALFLVALRMLMDRWAPTLIAELRAA